MGNGWYIVVTEDNMSEVSDWRFGKGEKDHLEPGMIVGMYDWDYENKILEEDHPFDTGLIKEHDSDLGHFPEGWGREIQLPEFRKII